MLAVEAPSRTRLVVLGLALATLAPASASAAEVVAGAPDQVQVTQGGLTPFEVQVTAEGVIDCRVSPSDPAGAAFDTVYSLVGGEVSNASPGSPLAFWAGNLVLLQPLGCNVTWESAPNPLRFAATVAAAANTPPGSYKVRLSSQITNPDSAFFGSLEDAEPEELTVVVEPPPTGQPPAPLPAPLENRSINLLPVRGVVRVRYPGSKVSVQLTDPIQVPPDTGVNAEEGFVTLLSDSSGNGDPQSTTLWNDGFRVDYTRVLHPEERGEKGRAKRPITELTLRGGPGSCGGGPARAARKGKGLWAKGKGRFRTRGRFGAGTVRGTQWFTRETCDGTLFKVRSGVVTVSDFTIDRSFAVRSGGSYLVQPPDPRRGTSRG